MAFGLTWMNQVWPWPIESDSTLSSSISFLNFSSIDSNPISKLLYFTVSYFNSHLWGQQLRSQQLQFSPMEPITVRSLRTFSVFGRNHTPRQPSIQHSFNGRPLVKILFAYPTLYPLLRLIFWYQNTLQYNTSGNYFPFTEANQVLSWPTLSS